MKNKHMREAREDYPWLFGRHVVAWSIGSNMRWMSKDLADQEEGSIEGRKRRMLSIVALTHVRQCPGCPFFVQACRLSRVVSVVR